MVAQVATHPFEDLDELVRRVVGKIDEPGEPTLQPGVGVDELGHLGWVAGGNEGEVVAVILHVLDDGVDGFSAEVVVATAGKSVSLVDEQRAAERRLEDGSRLRRRLPDVTGDEVRAIGLDEMALGHESEGAQDLAEQPGDGRLAGARIAREHEVVARLQRRQLPLSAQLLDAQQAGQATDICLHGVEADEVVELGEELFDRARRRRLGRWRRHRGHGRRRAGRAGRGGASQRAGAGNTSGVEGGEQHAAVAVDGGDLVG